MSAYRPFEETGEADRPRDFHARFSRRSRSLATQRRPRHHGRRLALLGVAIAVPAFAAPADWHGLSGSAEAQAQAAPMAFETPGESFPGSAFYYLADDGSAPPPALDDGAHWDDAAATPALAQPLAETARPLIAGGSINDQSRALTCLTQAIYYEAASESDAGQRAVAQVVLNRVAHPTYPNTVCGVVYQGSERRTGCQFSFTCDGALGRTPSRFGWNRARAVASAALAGSVYAPVGLATHYHTIQVNPYWAKSLNRVTTIGAHIFYRWGGAAGRRAAFQSAYAGGEPAAAPHARSYVDPVAALDPAVLARAYEQGLQQATAANATPVPDYTAQVAQRGGEAQFACERLPGAGSVKSEFARSGQWITAPR